MKCPWYISVAAVKKYLAIVGRPVVEDGPGFDRAERELMEMAIATMASDRVPKHTNQRLLRYRGPKPHRLQLIVSTELRAEGKLPQLVDVWPEHARAGQ